MTSFLRLYRLYIYRIVWCVISHCIKTYYTIIGYLKCKLKFKKGYVYYVRKTNTYYRYLGDKLFKEGNKIIDTGSFAIETNGRLKEFTYLSIGMFDFFLTSKN